MILKPIKNMFFLVADSIKGDDRGGHGEFGNGASVFRPKNIDQIVLVSIKRFIINFL
jgi:hypothetical protein